MINQSRALSNLIFSVLASYGLLSIKNNDLVPLYKLFNEQVLGLQFVVFTFVGLAMLLTAQQWIAKRALIKAALSARRHGKLSRMVLSGVHSRSFAYLKQEQDYGVEHKLPPMTIVYVVSVSSDMNRPPHAWVIPKFKEHVEGSNTESRLHPQDKPSLAIEVPIDLLYPHVPHHLIPELI